VYVAVEKHLLVMKKPEIGLASLYLMPLGLMP